MRVQGQLIGIFIAGKAGAQMRAVDSVKCLAERGIEGDRYFLKAGVFSKRDRVKQDITLIEQESVDALLRDYKINVAPRDLRRNLLTKNFALNHFVGREFSVGQVILRGEELCEPCGYLSKMLDLPLKNALKHRGGLRCSIVRGGDLALGDAIW